METNKHAYLLLVDFEMTPAKPIELVVNYK